MGPGFVQVCKRYNNVKRVLGAASGWAVIKKNLDPFRKNAIETQPVASDGKYSAQMTVFFNILKFCGIGLIRMYQWTIRPIIGPRCRFVPHCSDYAIESIERHGLFSGCWLVTKRLGRCHPWCQGGLDPVPETVKKQV